MFTSLFRIRKINKTYLGIVSGQLQKTEGTLIDDLHHYDKKKKIITRAVTHFKVLDSNGKFSLIKLNPETGRKHQLRKQLLLCGHPIIGDDKYKLFNKNSFKKNTLMLHAFKINFSIDGAKYKFLARLPIVFEKFLNEKYLKNFEL